MILRKPDREAVLRDAIQSNNLVIECDNCKRSHMLAKVSQKVPVPDHAGAFEVGVKCPDCGFWVHSFFVNARLVGLRQQLDKAAAQLEMSQHVPMPAQKRLELSDKLTKEHNKKKRSYSRAFNAYNDMMRKRYDVTKQPDQRQPGRSYHQA